MVKALADKKSATTIENKYLFEIHDLGLKSVSEYMALLKATIGKREDSIAELQKALNNANAEITRLNLELDKLKG